MKRIFVILFLALASLAAAEESIEERLMNAAKDYDFKLFLSLAKGREGINFNYLGKDGLGYLVYAAAAGDKESIDFLLAKGVDVNAGYKWGSKLATAMNFVTKAEAAEYLIKKGIRLNNDPALYSSPLMMLANSDYAELIEFLIRRGMDCEVFDANYGSPLSSAVGHHNYRNARIFVAHGGEASYFRLGRLNNQSPFSMLLDGVFDQDEELIDAMIQRSSVEGLNAARMPERLPNGSLGKIAYPLVLAAFKGREYGCVDKLLGKGAAVDVQDENGASLLMWAVREGRLDYVKRLFEMGASPELRGVIWTDKARGSYYGGLLQIAAAEKAPEMKAILAYLIEVCGIAVDTGEYDIQTKGRNTWTALFGASSSGSLEKAEYLLSKGADPKAEVQGLRLVDYLILGPCADERLPLLLIGRGAVPDIARKDTMIGASYKGFSKVAELLARGGAEVDSQTEDGLTGLFYAAMYGHAETVRTLLACGADPARTGRVKDGTGKETAMTPAQMTRMYLELNKESKEEAEKYAKVLAELEKPR